MSQNSYTALWRRLKRYFNHYGGWKAVLSSPLFGVALVSTILNYRYWVEATWPDITVSLAPNLLGFSLGTYAILFSLMTSRLKRALKLTKNHSGVSYLDEVNATFFHFILVQVISLLWAIGFNASWLVDIGLIIAPYAHWADEAIYAFTLLGSFIGFLLLFYSVLLILAAALAVYRIAGIVDPKDS